MSKKTAAIGAVLLLFAGAVGCSTSAEQESPATKTGQTEAAPSRSTAPDSTDAAHAEGRALIPESPSALGRQFSAVTAGSRHSCGLRSDDTISCWGNNEDGQATAPAGRFSAVTGGLLHSCGLRTDNTAACWGGLFVGAPNGVYRN